MTPEYVVAARMILRTTHMLGRSRSPREVRVPGTWHLLRVDSGMPASVSVCGESVLGPQATRPVQDWQIMRPRCAECEAAAGAAARAYAAREAAKAEMQASTQTV